MERSGDRARREAKGDTEVGRPIVPAIDVQRTARHRPRLVNSSEVAQESAHPSAGVGGTRVALAVRLLAPTECFTRTLVSIVGVGQNFVDLPTHEDIVVVLGEGLSPNRERFQRRCS